MNADSILRRIAEVLNKHKLEVVLFGNAAAAIQGAPVTTLDIEVFFRHTPVNMRKLREIAKDLDAVLYKPFYPASRMYRLSNDSAGIQIDFLSSAHGVKSFASLKSRAEEVQFGNAKLFVASLKDIIKSKKAAHRPQDVAVLPILEATLSEKESFKKTTAARAEKRKQTRSR